MSHSDRHLDPPEYAECSVCGEYLEEDGRCLECLFKGGEDGLGPDGDGRHDRITDDYYPPEDRDCDYWNRVT